MSEKHYPYLGGSFDRIIFDGDGSVWVPEAENAKLRERITTQKQSIQAYRDESREWREVAEHAQAENAKLREQGARLFDKTLELGTENAKLRELVRAAWRCIHIGASCSDCRLIAGGCTLQTAMRELGVEAN